MSSRRVGETLSAAIAIAGFVWIAHLCSRALRSVEDLVPDSAHDLALSLAFLSVALVLPSIVFRILVGDGLPSAARALALHFSGQLLKYLPGRVWGIVYQVSATSGAVDGARIVRANLELMLLATLVNVTVAVPVLGTIREWPAHVVWPSAAAGALSLAVAFFGSPGRIGALVSDRLPGALARHLARFSITPRRPRTLLLLVFIQVATLAAYVLSWHFLLAAYSNRFDVGAPELALVYLLASIVGMLSFVTPAGLGVREAAFVAMGAGSAGLDTLALLAVLVRAWHFATEIVLSTLFVVAVRATRRPSRRCLGGADLSDSAPSRGCPTPVDAPSFRSGG